MKIEEVADGANLQWIVSRVGMDLGKSPRLGLAQSNRKQVSCFHKRKRKKNVRVLFLKCMVKRSFLC